MKTVVQEMMFVVDTTGYAGNFERELTAFITGTLDESGKGRIEAQQFREFLEDEYGEVLRSVGRVTARDGQGEGDGYEELRQRGKKRNVL